MNGQARFSLAVLFMQTVLGLAIAAVSSFWYVGVPLLGVVVLAYLCRADAFTLLCAGIPFAVFAAGSNGVGGVLTLLLMLALFLHSQGLLEGREASGALSLFFIGAVGCAITLLPARNLFLPYLLLAGAAGAVLLYLAASHRRLEAMAGEEIP